VAEFNIGKSDVKLEPWEAETCADDECDKPPTCHLVISLRAIGSEVSEERYCQEHGEYMLALLKDSLPNDVD
jgi:hypothetical protein